ncbi:hypothetical protein GPECTOR_7g943 [Gonium pectorale]|uniref:Uncharacterized protein n=1 Tax=Gonium pectorale TaxID=33097 RepID=A0A150GUR3_GONPE|nr:hypothetical protein GPECTOR_7g943 [Gonium pectorale]|eukprot:KXZ53493.1 hypothetical protein GPECTOR_7g943 [Gonium pectorale]
MGSDSIFADKLTDQNAPKWFGRMMLFLMREALWDIVTKGMGNPPTDEERKADIRARGDIGLRLSDEHLGLAASAASAKELWDKLKATFAAKTDARKAAIFESLLGLKKSAKESISQYIARAKQIFPDLKECDVTSDGSLVH